MHLAVDLRVDVVEEPVQLVCWRIRSTRFWRFDAGVRLGETIAQDMVAVRIGPDMRVAAVAAPSHFATRPAPLTPQDLAEHNCINLRFPTLGGLYAWEFEKGGRALNVRVDGQLIVNEIAIALQAAIDGPALLICRTITSRLRSTRVG